MSRACSKCGRPFNPISLKHTLCPSCHQSAGRTQGGRGEGQNPPQNARPTGNPRPGGGRVEGYGEGLPQHLKLEGFYGPSGAIRREVYMDTAEGIAQEFNASELTTASIRRFFEQVRAAYEKYLQDPDHSYDRAMEGIYRLRPLAGKSEERGITKKCFTEFIEHYVNLAAKDERNLKGFKELFMSVIGYLRK